MLQIEPRRGRIEFSRPTGNRDNYPHHFAIDLRD